MCSLGQVFGFSDLFGEDAVGSRGSSGLVVSVSCPVSISHSLFLFVVLCRSFSRDFCE